MLCVSDSISVSMSRRSSKTDMHSAKTRAAGEREAILRKISGGRSFGDHEDAVVEGFHAGENLHERGLASAVAADKADAVMVA